MKIILTMISGPEGDTLLRCIRSFAPAIDGLAIAFGSGTRDCTETISEVVNLCAHLHLPLAWDRYHNAPDHADWPHIDNFAAARNLSLDLADTLFPHSSHPSHSSHFLLWCDADDILPAGIAPILRDIASRAPAHIETIFSPYVLGADQRHSRRERLFRPGLRWSDRVHEHIPCDMSKSLWAPEIQIAHAPAIDKTGSHDRNLRILQSIPEPERTGRDWFYLHEESAARGHIPLALEAGITATGRDDVKPQEKYGIYLRLGTWLKDLTDAERAVMESFRIDPSRREAVAMLGRLNLDRDPARALNFFHAASGIPHNPTDSPALHTWQLRDLQWIARTRLGQETATERADHFRQHGRHITVIHPTCRPRQAIQRRDEWLNKAEDPAAIEYIFGASQSDPEVLEALRGYPLAIAGPVPAGHSTAVVNHNAAAAASTGKIVIVAQDDIHPCEGWDMMIRRRLAPHLREPRVLHIHDGFRTDHIMVIMCVTRAWLHAHGNTLLCPEYDGYFSDTEFSLRAYKANQVIDGRDIRFFHNHPLFTGAPSDESYYRQQNPEAYARGEAIYKRRNP